MKEVCLIILSMFTVYGFYAALREVRALLFRAAHHYGGKIDKGDEMEYNRRNKP